MKFAAIRLIFGTLLLACPLSNSAPLPVAYLDRVVAIGRKDVTPGQSFGNWIGEASGFLYGEFKNKIDETHNNYQLFLVTNRHVIEAHLKATAGPLSVRLNPKGAGSVQQYDFPLIVDGRPTWFAHPNPAIDVAVVNLNAPVLEHLSVRFDYFRGDSDALNHAKARDLGLTEGYGVFVLGFPMNLVGTDQDYVIVREGSIARVRDTLDFPGRAMPFLIDSFVFPGNSGGPVVLKPEAFEFVGEKPAIKTAYLLGVVKGYLPYTDIAVSPQTQHVRVTFEENSGLTEVIPIEYVEETIQAFTSATPAPHGP